MPCESQTLLKGVTAKAGSWPAAAFRQVGELDALVGQHGVDAIRNGGNQRFQESGRSSHVCTFEQLKEGELRSAIDGLKKVKLAFGVANFGQVDVEVSDWVALELLPARLVAFHLRQAADAMPLTTASNPRIATLIKDGIFITAHSCACYLQFKCSDDR